MRTTLAFCCMHPLCVQLTVLGKSGRGEQTSGGAPPDGVPPDGARKWLNGC